MNIIIIALNIVCILILLQLIISKQIVKSLKKINSDIEYIKHRSGLIDEHINSNNKTTTIYLTNIFDTCDFIKSYMIRRKNPNKD